MADKLTTKDYWEKYYKTDHSNKKHIIAVCSYYDVFWNKLIHETDPSKSIIEIGGFPGRYLAYLSNKFKLSPTCLDYNSDITQIEASFATMDVSEYILLQEDFTQYKTESKYDYVISNGFIEHFDNYDRILDLHVDYMNEKGRLMVMIPNMKGYIKFYKYLVDYGNMKIHNLDCMRLQVFEDFAARNNLKINYLNYYGGFPLGVHQENNFLQEVIFKVHRLVFKYFGNKLLLKYPSRFFSSSIVAIFEKR